MRINKWPANNYQIASDPGGIRRINLLAKINLKG